MALEPVEEADVVQVAHIGHASLRVNQRAHNGAGAESQRIGSLVSRSELGGCEECLQTCKQKFQDKGQMQMKVRHKHALNCLASCATPFCPPRRLISCSVRYQAESALVGRPAKVHKQVQTKGGLHDRTTVKDIVKSNMNKSVPQGEAMLPS